MTERLEKRKTDQTSTLHNKKAVKSEQGEGRKLTNPELSQVVGGVQIVKPKIY